MIVTKQNLIDEKLEYNITEFLKSRASPKIYFKFLWKELPPKNCFIFHTFLNQNTKQQKNILSEPKICLKTF